MFSPFVGDYHQSIFMGIYIYTDMKGHKLRNVYIVPWKSDVAELLATGSKWTEKWVASRTTDFLLE
jgi:hypothetical protein